MCLLHFNDTTFSKSHEVPSSPVCIYALKINYLRGCDIFSKFTCEKNYNLKNSGSQPGVRYINSQGLRKLLAVRLQNTQYMVILVFNLIKIKKLPFLGTINYLGGAIFFLNGVILMWGYAKGYSFDLGVGKYQKVENPCCRTYLFKSETQYWGLDS